ncbi:MAG TPA: hypothetical protein VGA40_01950 [Candidatus Acidoferrales bacterium]
MAQEPSAVEQAVSRAIRDNLERLQRAAEEFNQALNDVTAACSSSRPTNALPHMLRAQSAAASLAASIEVMQRFITSSLREPDAMQAEVVRAVGEAVAAAPPPRERPVETRPPAPVVVAEAEMISEGAPVAAPPPPPPEAAAPEPEPEPVAAEPEPAPVAEFSVESLPADQQDLHRRANRVAKVTMQDIKMYKPDDLKLGRKNNDICVRLREDLDKAKKDYDRRFKPILDHPVDYFYKWLVEILAEGDPGKLGEYPYQSPVPRR